MDFTPLYSALKKYKKLGMSSFHTPGHKNSSVLAKNLLKLDYTELPDTDSLFESSGSILKAEQNASKLFNTAHTLFSAGGCTLCIQAMLRLACPFGGKIISSRMVHKGAVNAMALLKIEPLWVTPTRPDNSGIFAAVVPAEIDAMLYKNNDVCAVYITSPDYYGTISDISTVSSICKKHGVPLLVDNAHGSHLAFLSKNLHPIALGADICADSAHKTLPVLTGGAFLHIGNPKYANSAKSAMAMFGSTSPSYPVMASLDLCCNWLKAHGTTAFNELVCKVNKIKIMAESKGFYFSKTTNDPTRITFNATNIGYTGPELFNYFRENGVEPEFCDSNFVVLISTPFNSGKDFKRVERSILNIEPRESIKPTLCCFDKTNTAIPLTQALFLPFETIPTKNATGRISAETVCPCPPGIPVVVAGESITGGSVEILLNYGVFSINVLK